MNEEELRDRAALSVQRAEAIEITNQPGYEWAAAFLQTLQGARAEIAEFFDPMQKSAHAAWKAVIAKRVEVEAPIAEAESIVRVRMGLYAKDQERKRLEAEQAAREEADRLAQEQRDRDVAEAVKAGADEATVFAIADQPLIAVAAPVRVETAKADGISTRKVYRARVTDLRALIAHVASNPQLVRLLRVDEPTLNGMARSLKTSLRLPGVEVVEDIQVASRRR